MTLTLLLLPNGNQVMGQIVDETDSMIVVEHPISIVIANPMATQTAVYTARYSPLSKDSLVSFNKANIVSFSNVDDNLVKHYDRMVTFYKSRDFRYHADETEVDQEMVDEVMEELAEYNKSRFLH
jgi:hypothetical protein